MMNLSKITSGIDIETTALPAETGNIPHNIAVLGLPVSTYDGERNTPIIVADSDEAAQIFGAGSQLAQMVKPLDGVAATITCFALSESASATARSIELTLSAEPTSSGNITMHIAGEEISIEFNAGETLENIYNALAAAIEAKENLGFTATAAAANLTLESKWKDISANDISVLAVCSTAETVTLNPTSATGTADYTEAFAAMGSTWYTLTALPCTDEARLKKVIILAGTRADTEINMPMLCVAGNTQGYSSMLALVEQMDSMAMMILNVPGSMSMPWEIASDEIYKRIMCSQEQPNLSGRNVALRYTLPGPSELSPPQKEMIVKNGGATVMYLGSAVYVDNDATTCKTVDGKANDVWRWAGSIMNYFTKIYDTKNMFTTAPFDDYIMVDQGSKTSSAKAVKPGTVKQYLCNLIDQWELRALSKNTDEMKNSIKVSIPSGNAQSYLIEFMDDLAVSGKRIFVRYSIKISSNV